ncbi:MAG: FecR domain-containing protein [Rhizobiales bacterium]|nr:FecR domain-containing protein [Rhizobacter sp.]
MAATLATHARGAETVVEFVVVRADTLIGLSNSVLVSPTAWREVARINKLANPNRILPGQRLRIPTRLLRGDAVGATLLSVSGDVRSGDSPLQAGATIGEGQSVQTGPSSSAVIALADGSRVRVPPSSLAEVAASRNYGGRQPAVVNATAVKGAGADAPSHWFAGTLRVLRGSVEVFASKVLRAKPLEVVTPTAVVGVRGTQFRVGFDEAANGRTHAEVIEGAVRFDAAKAPAGAEVEAGFGAALDATSALPAVARLLGAPDLSAVPERFERPIVRFAVPGEGARPVRVQVASDPDFDRIVSDQQVAPGAEVRIVGLDDAPWHLRARRIDVQGIEGLDAVRPFVLKARPEPPAYRAPRADAKQAVGTVEFAWAPNVNAPRARLQVAEDAAFTRIVRDDDNVESATMRAEIGQAGTYHWRIASIRPEGDRGPYGDPQRFELRPLPEPAAVARSEDGSALMFKWGGRAEDRQRVEFARDAAFAEIIAASEVSGSEWKLPLPARAGRYYFRYRSVEPDGFIGPHSETLMVDVPRDWTPFGMLLPLLLLLP